MSRPSMSDLKRFFNRTPFLAGQVMKDEVTPTMDASLEWPLAPVLRNNGYTALAGTNLRTLASPRKGTHMLVVYGFFTTSAPAAGDFSVLFIQQKGVPTAVNAANLMVVELAAGRLNVPLINSVAQDAAGIFSQGVRSVYIPHGFELIHAYTGAAGGEVVTLRSMDYTFPETQPLSTLIEF